MDNQTGSPAPPLFERMSALTDPLRVRMLLVLEEHELAVSELCSVFQVPQSTMSRQLKVLGDEGWLVMRAEGTSRRYRLRADGLDEPARRLWQLMREQASGLPSAEQDEQRVRGVLAERRTRTQEFFSSAAGEWDRMREELFGSRLDLHALLGLLNEGWSVGDLGCGTGQVAEALAPFVDRVIAIDESPEMLAAARKRLDGAASVEVRRGSLEALPVGDAELDAAIVFLVLHHVPDPAKAVAEAARVLKKGGRLLMVDMTPHDRQEYVQQMGHLWRGFSEQEIGEWVEDARLAGYRYVSLPADPAARGPSLFAATARKR
jgi:ArsR family transcriptional regulator